MVWKWVRELADARTHSRSECGDGHDMNSVGAGVGGGASADGGERAQGVGMLYAWCRSDEG